jgi:heme a synthase
MAIFPRDPATLRFLYRWLFCCALLVVMMVVVGGLTRLTDSGLSITEWKPIHGVIPPLNATEWQQELDKYRSSPEYQQINKGMSLDAFKTIFWWEYAHRLLGRILGLVFLLPLLYLWGTGRIGYRLGVPLLLVFSLGGLQGLVGWMMVRSGLVDDPDVSPYKLMLHFLLAVLLFSLLLWAALMARYRLKPYPPSCSTFCERRHVVVSMVLCLTTMAWGAMVAGYDAGLLYPEFPTMGGEWVPIELQQAGSFFYAITHDAASIQFFHRLLGISTALFVFTLGIRLWRQLPLLSAHFIVMVGLQIILGVIILYTQMAIIPASLHQLNAVLLWGLLVVVLHRLIPVKE